MSVCNKTQIVFTLAVRFGVKALNGILFFAS